MTRIDVDNDDAIAIILVMRRQAIRDCRNDRWAKRVIEIADEIGFRQLECGCIAVDAPKCSGTTVFWRNLCNISLRDLVKFERKFNADNLSEGKPGGDQQRSTFT